MLLFLWLLGLLPAALLPLPPPVGLLGLVDHGVDGLAPGKVGVELLDKGRIALVNSLQKEKKEKRILGDYQDKKTQEGDKDVGLWDAAHYLDVPLQHPTLKWRSSKTFLN